MRTTRKKTSKGCETFCKGFVQRQKERVKTFRKALVKGVKGLKGLDSELIDSEMEKEFHKQCQSGYCNEGCKDTVFQDGSLPAAVVRSFKGNKEQKKLFKTMIEATRKGIFGKKKSVLKDNFYEGLPEKDVKRIKKEGATSGCTLIAL
jgi:hypothetical protein